MRTTFWQVKWCAINMFTPTAKGSNPLGATLIPLLSAIKEWAELHMEEVHIARQIYAERAEQIPLPE